MRTSPRGSAGTTIENLVWNAITLQALSVGKHDICLAQRSRLDSSKAFFWSTSQFRWLAAWGREKSHWLGFILNDFSYLAPGLVSARCMGSLESHQELSRKEEHYQGVMQISGLCANFRIGWITLSCRKAGSSGGKWSLPKPRISPEHNVPAWLLWLGS